MDTSENKTIAILGSGHICNALIQGLTKGDQRLAHNIIVSNPSGSNLKSLERKYGVRTTLNNKEATLQSDWIIIAVKPLVVKQVLMEIKSLVRGKFVFSLAAAVSMNMLGSYVNNSKQKFIRVMPNFAVANNEGVVGLFANSRITSAERNEATEVFSGLGKVIVLREENDLDILTLVAGCGPAIAAYFMEMLASYAVDLGLSRCISQEVSLQTYKGSALYLEKTAMAFADLKKAVSTKGGITDAILRSLDESNFRTIFLDCMAKGDKKIAELKETLNERRG